MACHGGPNIVEDSLVFHIDAANLSSIPQSSRSDPLLDDGVNDMTGNISSIDVDDSADAVGNVWKPEWIYRNNGCINFNSNGRGSSGDYDYGFLDLGTPVDGVTKFGETGCYTIDFWWKQESIDLDYVYQSGHIFGHRDVYTSYTSWTNRSLVYGSFDVLIYGQPATPNDYYSITWKAGQEDFTNSNKKYYSANTGNMFTPTTEDFPWMNHCCVFDLGNSLGSGSQIYAYINGVLANTSSVTTEGSASWYDNTTNGGNIYIGGSNRNGTGENLKTNGARGDMGPFKIYNKALTAAEVKQNFNALRDRYGR